jgi:hypothetical protein
LTAGIPNERGLRAAFFFALSERAVRLPIMQAS